MLAALVVLAAVGALAPPAARPAPRPTLQRAAGRAVRPRVLAVEDYVLTVGNLDRSVAFYRDVVGLPLWRAAERPSASPLEQSLTNTPGARFRSATFRNPGAGPALVLIEFTGIARRVWRPRAVDPGAALLQVQVHDLSRVLVAAARARAPVVTQGGRALLRGAARDIVVRDPDGFYVLFSQPLTAAPAGAATASTIADAFGLRMLYTVATPATLVRFYHGVLGLRVEAGAFMVDHTFDALLDAPGARLAVTQAAPADADATEAAADALRFIAFRGIARHTYGGRAQDPGTAGVVLRVADLNVALRAVRSSGIIVISAGGQPVRRERSATVLIRDPAGILVQLVQQLPPPPSPPLR